MISCKHTGFRNRNATYECGICKQSIGKPRYCPKCNVSLLRGSLFVSGAHYYLLCENCGKRTDLVTVEEVPLNVFASVSAGFEAILVVNHEEIATFAGPLDELLQWLSDVRVILSSDPAVQSALGNRYYLPCETASAAEQLTEFRKRIGYAC